MTLCPVAIAVGCSKCPIVGICPAKGIIGDYKPDAPAKDVKPPVKTRTGKQKSR